MKYKSICGGAYEVCEDGKIYSNKRKQRHELVGKVCNAGYRMVVLTLNRQKHYVNVHRLIAKVFVSNPMNLPEVNHIDGDKLNNKVSNLEWVSTRQNQLHAVRMGRSRQIKINMATAEKIRTLYATGCYTQRELAKMFDIGKTNIGYIINGKRWKNDIRQNERDKIQVGNKRHDDRR